MTKWVYSFGNGTAEGSGEQADLLGGKGAGLAEMSLLEIPVPPGFTVTTAACKHYHTQQQQFPDGLEEQLEEKLAELEATLDQQFGGVERPLLVSVRSGSPVSMPGMMDTVLNLGLSDQVISRHATGDDAVFYRDCYRRLLAMYGEVVLGVSAGHFDRAMAWLLEKHGAATEQALGIAGLDEAIAEFKRILEHEGVSLPQDPRQQLRQAIGAVFDSWHNRRAVEYRRLHDIPETLGTGVTVQAMVFGNRGSDCATGVAFSRDPATGELCLYGEYLVNAQGEDVVAGTHTPHPITPREGEEGGGLREVFPHAYDDLERVCGILERHFRNMQDLEFTIQHDRLFMLQTRAGKRSGPAAVRIAVDMVRERLIDRREAVRRVEPQHVVQMMAPVFDLEERQEAIRDGRLLATGLAAGPGAASGRIAFTAERAAAMAPHGPVLLVRDETSPEDIVGMHAAAGILTTRGGMTSHAAVVARGMGKPCVVGAADLLVDDEKGELRAAGRVFHEGEFLSVDGTRGEVLSGQVATLPSEVLQSLEAQGNGAAGEQGGATVSPTVQAFFQLLKWADRERRLRVRANADTPEDARRAVAFGAEGIGLCRTEHMFFAAERIGWVRQMILADDREQRAEALARLLPVQQADFEAIFDALAGRPVTIRLLDPPLHEFLPHGDAALEALAGQMGLSVQQVRDKASALVEVNPMLGHRGCRLGITSPDIYDMQTEAIARASCRVKARGGAVRTEIMIPLTGVREELAQSRGRVAAVVERVCAEEGIELEDLLIGTMIEVPRAALIADRLAEHSDFFSFGTNDLTQMTFGYSRDDVGRFLPHYIEQGILPNDPFERIDSEGVGQLVEIACRRGRMARRDLKLGVCGEHGGDPHSIEFFERCRLDYISCSPFRLPIARLAAARAAMAFGPGGKAEGMEDPLDR